ncbi:glycosyltransferase family 2 protein [Pseudobacter ginsenosidimutans]|uniref:Glycosyltransferase involved in cell wall biosynthesis n=1 Tax=Pseudobacter ginsenosidimutans TaxID=661488 RepID=A0A4Q7MTM2_9BACT|nr:glycosyltransferase family 2 protein [Pseudobacter ginsenosidimutans]QEC41037.1 glycosyltransferase family 2 protein [Pseudobacter ginsenosidimutans]RZS72212.1 glycosyltransferase involved in cell wall biosynthesis [Pseudobacter ginsenosidimutans]
MVSIIIPLFNKRYFIESAIRSVKDQTYTDWELIIVDDVSTDGSYEIVQEQAEKEQRIRVIRNQQNRGGNFCRNEGVRQTRGHYIIFFDGDDLLSRECLAIRVAAMEQHPHIDAGIFTLGVFTDRVDVVKRFWSPKSENALPGFLKHDLPWQTMQPIWRRDFIKKTGGFDEQFPRLQDVEFHTRALLLHNLQFMVFPGQPDCFFRTTEERKNFDTTSFLNKWVTGAVLYFRKFYLPAKEKKLDRYLNGTIYHTYMQLLWAFKQQKITKETFRELKQSLFEVNAGSGFPLSKKVIFQAAGFYNLLPVRIPGINLALRKLITL